MTTPYENRIIGYAELVWEVSAVGKSHTVRVLATSKFNAERDGSVRLGAPQWLCSARLSTNQSGLSSLGLA